MPIFYLPLVMYQAWMKVMFGPWLDDVENATTEAAEAATDFQTKATPV